MKIEPGRNVGSPSSTGKTGKSVAPGFAPSTEAPQRASTTSPTSGVASLDSLLALQGAEDPTQRRARQRRRGEEALDALEELEHGLVLGRASGGLKGRLEALQGRSERTGDAGLDAILYEIDVRLAVEAAKLERISGKV